ncbi:MAG: hypothetical protein KFH98_03885 [Gemmatimonadetes bacterium]|nr:hypothetical protein [Gemmatimonadota bacterium]
MMSEHVLDSRHTSSIRRITEHGLRWRVMVETWPEQDAYRGRLLFRREMADRVEGERIEQDRESAAVLYGHSRNDVVASAHDVTEDQLRRVLYSLG